MGLIISTITLVVSIPKIVNFVRQTKRNNLFAAVTNLIKLKWKKWHTKKRFRLYDFSCLDSFEKMSLLPFEHDYEMELPSQVYMYCISHKNLSHSFLTSSLKNVRDVFKDIFLNFRIK